MNIMYVNYISILEKNLNNKKKEGSPEIALDTAFSWLTWNTSSIKISFVIQKVELDIHVPLKWSTWSYVTSDFVVVFSGIRSEF